jgi:hypothetical protein
MEARLGELPIGGQFYLEGSKGTVLRKDADRVVYATNGGMQTAKPPETVVKFEGSVNYPKVTEVLLLKVMELVEAEAVQDLEAVRKSVTASADGGLKNAVHTVKERILERLKKLSF